MKRTERLKEWVDTLTQDQLKKIVLETVDYCIDSEEVSFYDSTKIPYWSNSGENLDGTESNSYDDF